MFYIGDDHNLYESLNGGAGQRLTSSANYHKVSAGLDTQGNAMAYMQQANGTFDPDTELDAWDGGRIMVGDQHSRWSAFSAADQAERVYYLGTDFSAHEANYIYWITPWGVWSGFTTQQLGNGTHYVQVSAGTDLYGNDTAYFLNHDGGPGDMQVYAWSESAHLMYCAQNFTERVWQVFGGRNGYFYVVDWNNDLREQIPTGERFAVVLDRNVWMMMGVGTNSEGYDTVNYERNDGTDVQYDTEYRYYWNMGQLGGVVAGEGGYNFWLDSSAHLHEIDPYGWDYVIASNVWAGM